MNIGKCPLCDKIHTTDEVQEVMGFRQTQDGYYMDVVLKGAILPVSLKMEDCACFEHVGDNDNCPRHAIVNHYTLGEEADELGRHFIISGGEVLELGDQSNDNNILF